MKTMLATVGICFVMAVAACAPKGDTTVSPAAFDDNATSSCAASSCCASKAAAAKASSCCASKAAATCPMSQKMSTEVN